MVGMKLVVVLVLVEQDVGTWEMDPVPA